MDSTFFHFFQTPNSAKRHVPFRFSFFEEKKQQCCATTQVAAAAPDNNDMIFCNKIDKTFFSLSFFPTSSSSWAKIFPTIFVLGLLLPLLVQGSNILETGEDLNSDRNGYVGKLKLFYIIVTLWPVYRVIEAD